MAQGSDYVKCAELLKKSIIHYMPDSNVTIVTTDMLPYGDQAPDTNWKLQNDWQVYEASPYEYTIKIEADMLITRSIDYWWDVLKQKDVVVCSTIRNFKQEISNETFYRRMLVENKLPNVFNGITYFRKSDTAQEFFELVKEIFENWKDYRNILVCDVNEKATTDWVYAIACHLMGLEKTTMPNFTDMSFTHMKMMINGLPTEDWTDSLIYELNPQSLRINTYTQMYPFHYHIKDFPDKINEGVYGN